MISYSQWPRAWIEYQCVYRASLPCFCVCVLMVLYVCICRHSCCKLLIIVYCMLISCDEFLGFCLIFRMSL